MTSPRVPFHRYAIPLAAALLLAGCGGSGAGDPAAPPEPPEPPRVNGLDPVEARARDEVRILGERFGADSTAVEVTFAGEVAHLLSVDETSIEVLVPELEPGVVTVRVTVDGRTSNEAVFTVLETPVVRPPMGSIEGQWEQTLIRIAAEGSCPDPQPESEVVELRLVGIELVLGETSGEVDFDGTWRATGEIVLDDGTTVRRTIEARFTIVEGQLGLEGTLVLEHFAPDGTKTCTETYDLKMKRLEDGP